MNTHTGPNLLSLYTAYYGNDQITLVLEYMNRSSLLDILKACGAFTEDVVQIVAAQTILGLAQLHANKQVSVSCRV